MSKTMKQLETFREWLDRRELTVDRFVHALPTFKGELCLSTSTANKLSSENKSKDELSPAIKLAIRDVFPDCPLVL